MNALIFDGEPIVKVTELEQALPRETYKDNGVYHEQEWYPVITLVLYFGEKPWNGPKSLKERLTIPEGAEQYVNDYKLHIIEMSRLSREKIEKFQSDFRIIAEYFWHEAMGEDYYGDDKRSFM